jgi:serine/threonine protein kinase
MRADLHLLHCDIKPENIFFHQNIWYLGDFGSAVSIKGRD